MDDCLVLEVGERSQDDEVRYPTKTSRQPWAKTDNGASHTRMTGAPGRARGNWPGWFTLSQPSSAA